MGILAQDLEWFHRLALKPPASILELGSQTLFIHEKPWPDYPERFLNPGMVQDLPTAYAKDYFEDLGYDHVSIDLNGRGGSQAVDLSKNLTFGLDRDFDLITDFGTSEHVADLYSCLSGIYCACYSGSLMFHVNPEPASWPGHGHHYRGLDFYRAFAAMTRYEIIDLYRIAACGNLTDGWNTACCMRKNPWSIFPSREEFSTLPIKTK